MRRARLHLVPYLLTPEERALPKPDSEPESLFHGWLTGRYREAIDGWKGGGPMMLCAHILASPPPVRYWFACWPETQLCELCGEKIRATMKGGPVCDRPAPLDRCHVCGRQPDSGSWFTDMELQHGRLARDGGHL